MPGLERAGVVLAAPDSPTGLSMSPAADRRDAASHRTLPGFRGSSRAPRESPRETGADAADATAPRPSHTPSVHGRVAAPSDLSPEWSEIPPRQPR